MKEYLLISKGSHRKWENISESEKAQLDADFKAWIQRLSLANRWVRGNGLPKRSLVVKKEEGEIVMEEASLSSNDESFTGVFIIKARDPVEASEVAKDCPTLKYDEVFVFEMGDQSQR